MKQEVLTELNAIKFPLQERKNVLRGQKSYQGFVLGLVTSWAHNGGANGKEKIPSQKTKLEKYKNIFLLSKKMLNQYDPSFKFTSIQFNKNHRAAKHLDSKNVGVSYIIGLGDYTGGNLMVYDEKGSKYKSINIKNKFYKFNGSIYPHETEPFQGTRYTLVYYSI